MISSVKLQAYMDSYNLNTVTDQLRSTAATYFLLSSNVEIVYKIHFTK